jgi:branched-chain amino acid transport system substrate-binding protein
MALFIAACGSNRDAATTTTPTTKASTGTTGATGTTGGSSSSSASSAATANDPGITDSEITLGSSYPFSGPASAYGTISKAEQAYFKAINDKGGVKSADGKTRKITLKVLDDGYTPARTVENVKQLVEQDKVFAVFNSLGTANNTAIYDYMNQQKVPQIFVATGATKWGQDIQGHPWTIGYQATYSSESKVYVEYLKKESPNAKVAILEQNDDYGKDYVDSFTKAIGGTGITVVATQTYELSDPTVDSQVTNLSQTDADVFYIVATPKFAAQAIKKQFEIGWTPKFRILNSVSAIKASVLTPAGLDASTGLLSVTTGKDVSDPQWANDEFMKKYIQLITTNCPDCDGGALNSANESGYSFAEAMVKALEGMKAPTRQALMDSARNLDYQPDLALPGVKVKTTPTDGYCIESAQVEQFDGTTWKLLGSVIDTSK